MHTLTLSGCAPIPLAHYLKALGILRLVSEQADPNATGCWHRDQFVLTSKLDRDELLKFFLEDYQPTPVMAPWNGGSGFHPKDNSRALNVITLSPSPRFKKYADSIRSAQSAISSMSLGEKPTPEQKAELLLLCRNVLPEHALQWLDAAYILTDDGAKYPPLLGTGGNDGRLEFTNNFMQRITEVIDSQTGGSLENSQQHLASSLFAESSPTPLTKSPIGQFLPSAAGGANATSGFDAASAVNPWDFILMIEGALLFASASVKRLESNDSGALAYPFCVRQSGVGYASSSDSDESASRAEMWMPLWTQRPVTLPELSAIFSEGRAQVGKRAAKNGVDFARAVVGLGIDRGLDEFQRYGFQVRNGLSYFATPLTRVVAKKNHETDLLNDIDAWLDRFRRAATGKTAPASTRRSLSQLESAILDLCTCHSSERLLAVFIALGQCQATAARSLKWASDPKTYLSPLQGLRKAWLQHGWHRTEFRLAASLASINGQFGKEWLPFRCHLESVESMPYGYAWAENPSNNVQWSQASLPEVLNDILARRFILTETTETRYEVWASLADIKSFIEGETDDALLSELLWSMSLINWRDQAAFPAAPKERRPVPQTLYALLKLCFPPVQKNQPDDIRPVPLVPSIHRHASHGNGSQAAALAIRRLRASGYEPHLRELPVMGDYVKRTAAALLFPISDNTLLDLLKQTTRPQKEPETAKV